MLGVFINLLLCVSLSVSINPLLIWSNSKYSVEKEDLISKIDLKFDFTPHFLNLIKNFDRVNVFLTNKITLSSFQDTSTDPLVNLFKQSFIDSKIHLHHWVSKLDDLMQDLHYAKFQILFENSLPLETIPEVDITNKGTIYVYSLPLEMNSELSELYAKRISNIIDNNDISILNIVSSLHNGISENKASRQFRQDPQVVVAPMKKTGLVDDGTFFNVKNCIYFYARNIQITLNKVKIPLTVSQAAIDKSTCQNTSSILNLEFTSNLPGYTSINIITNFIKKTRYWACSNIAVTFVSTASVTTTVNYACPILKANNKLSYSCFSMNFSEINGKFPDFSVLNYQYFHIEPFVTAGNKEIFSPSDTCCYFVSIPILMGIFIFTIVALIVAGGLISILNIKGQDRAQNPKEFTDIGAVIR